MADGVGIWISGHRYNARFLDFRQRDVKIHPAFGGSSGGCSCIRDLMCIFSMELHCRHFLCPRDTGPHWVRGPPCIVCPYMVSYPLENFNFKKHTHWSILS